MITSMLFLTLMTAVAGAQQGQWPSEDLPLNRNLIESKWTRISNGRYYQDVGLNLEVKEATTWVESIDRYWAALPPEGAVLPEEIVGPRTVVTSIQINGRSPGFSRRYKAGRTIISMVLMRAYGSTTEASAALTHTGEVIQGIVSRVALPDFVVGDECKVINGHPREGIEFRVGRFVVRVPRSGTSPALADRIAANLARAVAFRLYSSGVAGEPHTVVTLLGGQHLTALQIGPFKFVSLESLRPYIDSITEAPAGTEPGRILKRGTRRVEVRAYTTRVLVNGEQRGAPAAIPYASDLWIPYDPVVSALGH